MIAIGAIIGGVYTLTVYLVGYYRGEQRGIADTEERWNDAVCRKHDGDI